MKKLIFAIAIILVIAIGTVVYFNTVQTSNTTKELTIGDLINKFKEANLSTENNKKMEDSDFGAAPKLTNDAYIFTVQDDMNARLFKIDDSSKLNELKKYYDDLGESSILFYSHTYSKGKFLLQMNGSISEEIFNKYVDIINSNI